MLEHFFLPTVICDNCLVKIRYGVFVFEQEISGREIWSLKDLSGYPKLCPKLGAVPQLLCAAGGREGRRHLQGSPHGTAEDLIRLSAEAIRWQTKVSK